MLTNHVDRFSPVKHGCRIDFRVHGLKENLFIAKKLEKKGEKA
jgi:hypothetical protein